MKVSLLVLATLLLTTSYAFPDSVTLNGGEVIQGEIVSETDAQIAIRVSNYNKTITSQRLILKSDIKTVQRESAQQKQERQAYEALTALQLDPNRELSKTEYDGGIETFNKFLAVYPESKFTDDIRQRIALWKSELSHVEKGEAKFDNQWMTPNEKKPLMDKFLKQQQVQATADTLQSLKQKLNSLGYQRQNLTESIAQAERSVKYAQNVLANPPKIRVPVSQTTPDQPRVPASPYYDSHKTWHSGAGEWIIGDPIVINKARSDLAFYQAQVNQGRQQSAALDNSINDTKRQIAQTESENRIAVAKLQELTSTPTPKPAPIVQPTVASVSPQPVAVAAVPEPKPWIVRNWKGLALGGGILLILLIVAYQLNRVAARVQTEAEPQRRAARERLRKIFDRIMVEGERPEGMNTTDGEIIPIGKGQDASGGGRWFVIGPDHIWAVQNNGKEDDNWALNNVKTYGPGAIGARIPVEAELADSIKTLGKATG
jgi:hypothetical protein